VVGDAVNVASRIESLNKQYGSMILVSEFTWAATEGEFAAIGREIDRVQVRGRAQPVGLYELIPEGRYGSLDWLDDFNAAYRKLQDGDRAGAEAGFAALVERIEDPVSAYHLKLLRAPRRRTGDRGD
jgi:adenylate cyclase